MSTDKMPDTKYQILLFLSIFLLGCTGSRPVTQVCFKGQCIEVELAQTQEERARGLQNREYLDTERGMLFLFSDSRKHSFWMKETLIPLDIIWLDYARRIIHIEANVPPCQKDPCPSYVPSQDAMYVLELNAGKSKEFGLEAGDVVEFHLDTSAQRLIES
ncbi:MAG: DUF192 domain-containing protein [Candidatus Omnitrophica bacterium]|nr:DUF192 domain-containing protein [Candidatus Omnitrophota bacterium]